MDRQTNRRTDNAISRVAFATEKVSPYGGILTQLQFNHSPPPFKSREENRKEIFWALDPPPSLKTREISYTFLVILKTMNSSQKSSTLSSPPYLFTNR